MFGRFLCVLACCAAVAACQDPAPPAPSPGGGSTGETITGRERLGWDQQAASAAELASYRFIIYVDGARTEVADASCASTGGTAGFACSGRFPSMSPGAHTLELAAYIPDADLEGPRSSPFRVTVSAVVPGDFDASDWSSGEAGITTDGVALAVEQMADGLQRPSDAAFSPDGRLFIAERGGTIRILQDGRLRPAPALKLDGVFAEGGLLGIALDPEFARTRLIYTLSAIMSESAVPVYRLARYRELAGIMAQRAVLLETPAPAVPAGTLRFGPDNLLYLALGAGSADTASSYGGKVLRLNADGTMPGDRRTTTPIVSRGHVSPRAMAWRPGGGLLWIADGSADGLEWITAAGASDDSQARWGLPGSETTSGMAFYRGDRIPEFSGDLLIASATARRILRVRFGSDQLEAVSTELLLADRVGPITVVLPGLDGAIYFCTESAVGRLVRRQ